MNHPRNLLRDPLDPNANLRNHHATKLTPPSSTPHNKPSTPPLISPLSPQRPSHNHKETLLPQLNPPCHPPPSQPVSPGSQQVSHRHSIPWLQESTTSNYTAPQQTPSLPRYCASAPNALKSAMLRTHSNDSQLKGTTVSNGHRVYHAHDHARIWALYSEPSVESRGDSHRRPGSTYQVSNFRGDLRSFQRVLSLFLCSFHPSLCV